MTEQQVCPRCCRSLPPEIDQKRRGRRRIWCSDDCRRQAHAERVAAERAGLAVRVVEVPRTALPPRNRPLTAAETAELVLADQSSCIALLEALTEQARRKQLDNQVRSAVLKLARMALPHA